MKLDNLIAIDTHVHIEPDPTGNAAEEAARKYFGNTGVSYGRKELAEYYRSRKIGCVVFSVDERLTGRPQVPNDEVAAFAAENSDIVMAFASVDPMRGADAVKEARRLIATGGIRGFKLHPPLQQFHANDKAAYPFYEVVAEAKLPVIFHTGHSGIGTGMPGGGGVRLKYGNPMDIDDVAVDFPDMPIIMAHPSFPVAGRGDFGVPAQAAGLHRSIRMVAEVFLAHPDSVREYAAEEEDAVRVRLSADHAGPLDGGFRGHRDPRRSAAAHLEGKRRASCFR